MGGCAAVERLLGRAVPAHQVDLGDVARRSMSDAEEDAPPWALSAGPSRAAVGSRPAMVARVGSVFQDPDWVILDEARMHVNTHMKHLKP
jgi:hypothetical protein